MENLIKLPESDIAKSSGADNKLAEITESLLSDAQRNQPIEATFTVPIGALATLGAVFSSMIPELHTIKQTMTFDVQGLFLIANAEAGDILKMTKSGKKWAVLKKPDGSSKLAQLLEAGPISATSTTAFAPDPTVMMVAVALFTIEQKLSDIEKMEQQILSFLEVEKQSEIEADVQTLVSIIKNYKLNWDNEHFLQGNHKLVLDIQRTARKNMLSYQKMVTEELERKHLFMAQAKVCSMLNDLLRKFQYYRLSLYTFSMASLLEILLGGNFREEYIEGIRDEVEELSLKYRSIYTQCSELLEKMWGSAVEANLLKGIGNASDAVGKFIGSIPKIRDGQMDEFLQDRGEQLKKNVAGQERDMIKSFAAISDPGTRILTEKMQDLNIIYNHAREISCDGNQICLVTC